MDTYTLFSTIVGLSTFILIFILAYALRLRTRNPWLAWGISGMVLPVFVLIDEFLLPYSGGGASFFPLSLIFAIGYGAMIGGAGVYASSFNKKIKQGPNQSSEPT